MTADLRTAARAEAEATARFGPPDFSAPNDRTIKWTTYVWGFTEGAVWAQARVTPTREQIAEVIASSGAYGFKWEQVRPMTRDAYLAAADAVLALITAEGSE